MASPVENRPRVAILEDYPVNRDRLSDLVRSSGYVPIPVSPKAPALIDFDAFLINESISMILCDHRLYEKGDYANYTGAQAVAKCYQSGRGGVLVTGYENDDAELSIREYRRWIPSLIHGTELDRKTLTSALANADKEVRHNLIATQREPYRTVMTVTNLIQKGETTIVKVVMGQWDPNTEIGFPIHMLPSLMRPQAVPGNLLIAQVNLLAERPEDLFFDNFQLPDPDVLQKSQAFFNRS